MTNNGITVVISTRNRPFQLKDCLNSILKSSYKEYEILIADQSTDNKTKKVVESLRSKKIHLIHMDKKGKSVGLNLLIEKAKTEILAFTDDDCIVSKNWLKETYLSYKRYPNIAGVFGNTLPYRKKDHTDEICPALFEVKKSDLHVFENLNYYKVGIGNNMSIKRSVFMKIGLFKEWLGPGSIGKNGEENDIVFRILKNNLVLATNPKSIVFHNKWLSKREERILQTHYSLGFIASLSYRLLSEDRGFAWMFIKMKVRERIKPIIDLNFNLIKKLLKENCFFLTLELVAIIKGISLGIVISTFKKDKKHLKNKQLTW